MVNIGNHYDANDPNLTYSELKSASAAQQSLLRCAILSVRSTGGIGQ
jgi:hypothetical protein